MSERKINHGMWGWAGTVDLDAFYRVMGVPDVVVDALGSWATVLYKSTAATLDAAGIRAYPEASRPPAQPDRPAPEAP